MYPSITPLLTELLKPDVIAKMTSSAGISDVASAQKTISGAVPTILSGLANLVSKPDKARQLSDAIASQPSNLLENLAGTIGASGQLANIGGTALTSLFGSGTLGTLTSARGIGHTLAQVARLSFPYFRSKDCWAGRGLLGAILGIELARSAFGVAQFLERALLRCARTQERHCLWVRALDLRRACGAIHSARRLSTLFEPSPPIRWRQWMTDRLLGSWLKNATPYRMQLSA